MRKLARGREHNPARATRPLRSGLRMTAKAILGMPRGHSISVKDGSGGSLSTRFGKWWTRHPRLLHAFVAVSLLWSSLYLAWRVGFSVSGANIVLWAALLVAEIYGAWNLAMLAWLTWSIDGQGEQDSRPQLENVTSLRRTLSIDVYVCTYDEPLHVLDATLAGCALLTEPHTTYLLDDGAREEMRELAEKWGAHWITRPDKSHAKAGNINHALPLTSGDLVLVLDADHVPMPDALTTLARHFDDDRLAVVQSPHDFSNHDSVQHYDVGRHEQSLFFSAICPGKDRHGAAFWCGSAALIRRSALMQVGGVATETIAEDFHTTVKLHRKGWRSRYEPRTVVQGKAPHDLASYLLQRDRWARGNLAVFTTPESPLRAKELTFQQRLSYFASLTAYFAGPVRLLLLGTLIAVLWSGALPLNVVPLALIALWAPATGLGVLAGTALCRGLQSAAENSHFELCTAEIFTRAMRCVARPGRTQFKVTPKEGVDHGGWESVKQFRIVLAFAALLSVGVLLRVAQDLGVGFLPPMHGFAMWFVPLLGAVELRRVLRTLALVATHRQLRSEYRTPLRTGAMLTRIDGTDDTPLLARVTDVTPSGIGAELPMPLPAGSRAKVSLTVPTLTDGGGTEIVPIEIQVRSCSAAGEMWRLGAAIVSCDESARQRLVEYCHVIWPYMRLNGQLPEEAAAPVSAPRRARIAAIASGLLSIST